MKEKVGPRRRPGATRNSEGGPSACRFREPPTLPQTETAVVSVSSVTSKHPQQAPPLVNLVRRGMQICLVLLLAVPDRVRNEPNARVSSEARRTESHQPRPGKIAGNDPVCRRKVRADSERHIRILELIERALASKSVPSRSPRGHLSPRLRTDAGPSCAAVARRASGPGAWPGRAAARRRGPQDSTATRRGRRRPSMYGRPRPATSIVLPSRPSQPGSGRGGSEPATPAISAKYVRTRPIPSRS